MMRQIPNQVRPDGAAAAGWQRAAVLDIAGITADSRQVHTGDLFVAVPGSAHDGRAFIADAVANGAAAVLAPTGTEWPPGMPPRPLIEDPEPRRSLAQLAAALAGPPPRDHGRGHRHQRQDQHGRVPAPALERWPATRPRASARSA